jgi:hypothetical protein
MLGVSRRLVATVGAAATILMLTTSVVAAADPDSFASARANGSSAGAVTLGARSQDARPARLRLDHGGGLKPPATDIELAPIAVDGRASGIGLALTTWVLVFAASVVASLRWMARRSRL